MERTLVLAKPDAVQRGLVGDIITRMERRGFKLVAIRTTNATKHQAQSHYEEHRHRPFFSRACRFLCSGPVVAMGWEGLGVVEQSRRMIGSTDPQVAQPGTIRGDHGAHFRRNLVHASDSVESARREINLWFDSTDFIHWDHSQANWIYELPNAPIDFDEHGDDHHPGHLSGPPGVRNDKLPFKKPN